MTEHRARTRIVAAVVSLAAFASAQAYAQDSTNESFSQELTESLLSGRGFEQNLRDVPFYPIPRISEEEFRSIAPPAQELERFNEQDDTIQPTESTAAVGTPEPADVTKFPYKVGGALFFTRNGRNYRCSAQFMGDPTVLLTAAHCLRDSGTGTWNSRTVFYRAYAGGTGDFHIAQCIATKHGWVSGSNKYKWDYAFVKLTGAGNAGTLGYKSGAPYATFESMGYPGNFGSGATMHKVTGTKGWVKNDIVQMLNNPMTFGASGGAWIGDGKYAIGVNSFIYQNDPGKMHGPLFDAQTVNLYEYARRGCRD